jgi:ubiquinone/menaquinone biosynthesis C-methylase UbiE
MQRVPEPALMDDPAQAAAYAGGDLDNAYWLFVQLFRKYFPDLKPSDAILDLGCGPGAIPLRLAKLFRTCQIHCVDGAAHMLEQGKRAAHREGLEEQIHFFQGSLPDNLPLPRNRYKVIISNSFLHHLADPMVLWNAIHQYCLPKAAILIVDLLRPTDEEKTQLVVDQYMPDGPPLLRQDMLLSLRAAFTLDEIKAQLQQANLAENLSLTMATPIQFAAYGYLD